MDSTLVRYILACIFYCLNEFFIQIWFAACTVGVSCVHVFAIVALNKIYGRAHRMVVVVVFFDVPIFTSAEILNRVVGQLQSKLDVRAVCVC